MATPETREHRKDRLKAVGKWTFFVKRRKEWERRGYNAADAERLTDKEYQKFGWDEISEKKQKQVTTPSGNPGVSTPAGSAKIPMIDLKAFAGKPKAGAIKNIDWIFDNMMVESPDQKTCPSAGAWGYLWECRLNHNVRSEFYKSTYSKLLPSRTQLETRDKFSDDGAAIIENISKVEELAFKAMGLEALPGPPMPEIEINPLDMEFEQTPEQEPIVIVEEKPRQRPPEKSVLEKASDLLSEGGGYSDD